MSEHTHKFTPERAADQNALAQIRRLLDAGYKVVPVLPCEGHRWHPESLGCDPPDVGVTCIGCQHDGTRLGDSVTIGEVDSV